jgi:TatD DNase family protein
MHFIDSHTHLQHRRFAETESPKDTPLSTEELIKLYHMAKVSRVITIACRRDEWAPALALAETHADSVSVAIGIHPQDVTEEPSIAEPAELIAQAANPHVVALGETGLDYFYENSPREQQAQSFHNHMVAAKETGLPVVIHTRDAEEDTIRILKEHPGVPFVLHCFTGTEWLARQGVELGGYISFSGILTFKKSQALRDIAAMLPRDRILIETDAPYLAPEPNRSRRNMPAYLPYTAQVLANVWQCSIEEVAEITSANTRRLFSRLANV